MPDPRRDTAASTGRELALQVLQAVRGGKGFAQENLDRLIQEHSPSGPDAHLATELALGVLRWRLTLHRLLRPFVRADWQRLHPVLADALLLAAYQLWMLDRIPAHAAVSQSVALAKASCGRQTGNLANAVLRNMLRQLTAQHLPIDQLPEDSQSLWRDAATGLRFDRPVWPDPGERPLDHLAITTSHPLKVVKRWVDNFGLEAARGICRTNQHRPPIVVRPNPLRCSAQSLQATLAEEGVSASLHAQPGLLVLQGPVSLRRLRTFSDGLFQPQDATASQAVCAGWPRPGELILDLCAAPGGKATQAAELMHDQGTVLACDVSEPKLARVQANAQRLGLRAVRCTLAGQLKGLLDQLSAPRLVIVDVPCSNTGVLSRRPEARYRFTGRRLEKLVRQAEELLATATRLADPAGRVVYATCSIEPEENERLVQGFCQRDRRWRLADSRLTLPHAGTDATQWQDGGYWALLVAE